MRAKIAEWCSENRELLYALLALVVMVIVWKTGVVQRYLDPRPGFDGWSDTLYLLPNAVNGFLVVAFAYVCLKATHGVTTNEEDRQLRQLIKEGHTGPRWMYALQMLCVAFWVCFWSWRLS